MTCSSASEPNEGDRVPRSRRHPRPGPGTQHRSRTRRGLLDSAVARPRSNAFGEDAYPTISLQAAALLHSLTNNHALADGNKILAWLATVVFLDLNGLMPDLTDGEAFALVWAVASTSLEVEAIARRIRTTR